MSCTTCTYGPEWGECARPERDRSVCYMGSHWKRKGDETMKKIKMGGGHRTCAFCGETVFGSKVHNCSKEMKPDDCIFYKGGCTNESRHPKDLCPDGYPPACDLQYLESRGRCPSGRRKGD
jgi:hypothetical protein